MFGDQPGAQGRPYGTVAFRMLFKITELDNQ